MAPPHLPSTQRRSCLLSPLKASLSAKGTCRPVPGSGCINVNGWLREPALANTAAPGTFLPWKMPEALPTSRPSQRTTARHQLGVPVLSHSWPCRQPPAAASSASSLRIPPRQPARCHSSGRALGPPLGDMGAAAGRQAGARGEPYRWVRCHRRGRVPLCRFFPHHPNVPWRGWRAAWCLEQPHSLPTSWGEHLGLDFLGACSALCLPVPNRQQERGAGGAGDFLPFSGREEI